MEKNQFVAEDIKKIIEKSIETIIGEKDYDDQNVNEWSGTIINAINTELISLQKPYKYISKYFIIYFILISI